MTKYDPILIIDYGLGNLNSVARGVLAAGGKPLISQDPQELKNAKKVILPGVGAFSAGMNGLKKRKLVEPILEYVKSNRELLGLCLGMQLLFKKSEEFGNHMGLGFFDETIKQIIPKQKDKYKIPHVGWNSLTKTKNTKWHGTILENIDEGDMVYFVHSFASKVGKHSLAHTEYGGEIFSSAVALDNIIGTQFHPEKSGKVGLKILEKFIKK